MSSSKKSYSKLYSILFFAILCLGSFLRIYSLGNVPAGYQMDEAYGAFNAYSLYHCGMDSTGHSFPVYFEAWGGGQNALNSYLMLPFLALFGGRMNPLVVRLPQVMVSIATLVAVFFLMKRIADTTTGLWAMFLLSICPWHVMMSRWGLESNLAPGFLILGLCFFTYGLRKPYLFIPSAFCYGLSLYCYATIWVVVPVLLLLEWGYGFWTKTLKVTKYFILHIAIIFSMALPLLFFLLVNKGVLPEFAIGPFSIYRMTDLRDNELAHSINDLLTNLKNLFYLLYRQDVGRPYDVIMPFGFFGIAARYVIFLGVVLLLLTFWQSMSRKKKPLSILILIQLFGAFLLGLLVRVGMTQINCIYIPLVMCGALGITTITNLMHSFHWGRISSCVLLAFFLFETFQFQQIYYTSYKETVSAYFQEGTQSAVLSAMEHAREKNGELQIEDALKYPSVLLFAQMDAREFLSEIEYSEQKPKPASFVGKGVSFRMGIQWESIDPSKVYILYESDVDKFRNFRLEQYQHWYVAY